MESAAPMRVPRRTAMRLRGHTNTRAQLLPPFSFVLTPVRGTASLARACDARVSISKPYEVVIVVTRLSSRLRTDAQAHPDSQDRGPADLRAARSTSVTLGSSVRATRLLLSARPAHAP